MKKTWKELKDEILGLGFSNESPVTEASMKDAVNRALTLIALSYKAKVKSEQVTAVNGIIAKPEGEVVRYCNPPLTKDGFESVACFELPNGNLRTDEEGEVTLWYEEHYAKIKNIADSDELTYDSDVFCLLPLLTAFYIWQEDDERKALICKNEYEAICKELKRSKEGRGVVQGGLYI